MLAYTYSFKLGSLFCKIHGYGLFYLEIHACHFFSLFSPNFLTCLLSQTKAIKMVPDHQGMLVLEVVVQALLLQLVVRRILQQALMKIPM